MIDVQELEQNDVSDDPPTKAQTRRTKPNMLAIATCLISMAVPFPQRWFDGSMNCSSPHYYTGIKPKWKDPDEPLCVMDADDLEDADILVHASQEPAQAQKEVLLRAAQGGQEQHSEQLLRASVGAAEEAGR